eukprot:CAMPEP_0174859540 /NCGR_PEP_ID=MMETSP1114-20130205/46662_1 /TAXON_ID=312471 /ORGANISM="Neobodo designis, Strain CCAP 1951/1" /LENGTH=44 /DNA_ID= /DNA_START= /DNA_END= /DNA_ORIENTATION=
MRRGSIAGKIDEQRLQEEMREAAAFAAIADARAPPNPDDSVQGN